MRLLTTLICLFFLSLTVFAQRLVLDPSFAPALNGEVKFLEVLSDGKILIAGDFSTVNGVARHRIARLNADGTLDTSFDATSVIAPFDIFQPSLMAMKLLPGGKILITGYIPAGIGGGIKIRRLNPDGSNDTTLTSIPYLESNGNYQVINMVDQLPNGKILMCGDFDLPNNNAKPDIARYNADGTYDSSFTTTINFGCHDIEALPDGKYYLSGEYSTINGNPSQSLVRFNSNDGIDPAFNAAPIPDTTDRTYYHNIELQSDGKIIAFRGRSVYKRVSRLNPDGSLHMEFPGNVDYPGDAALQSNGKVIVTAEYATDNPFGLSEDLNRYNTDGTPDGSLNRLDFYGGDDGYVKAVSFTANGSVIAGGDFTQIMTNGVTVSRSWLARFTPQAIPFTHRYDFDGDGRDDIAVFRPGNSVWHLNRSTAGYTSTQFGLSTDTPIVYDHDGDGKADIAVFRDGVWYWLRSTDGVFAYKVIGQAGDIPQPSSFNAYGLVYRPSAASFYTQQPFSDAVPVTFPNMTLLPTDKPIVADYDGDQRDDLAVFRDGNWFVRKGFTSQVIHYQFGIAGDKPVPADYDGDGRADYAVYRPSNGVWYFNKTTEGFYAVGWGLADDIPVPADYDGDGKTDIAVYRPSNGVWYQIRSNGTFHFEAFGLADDIPAQAR